MTSEEEYDNALRNNNATTTTNQKQTNNSNNQFQLSNINLFTLNKLLQASLYMQKIYSTKHSQSSSSSFQQQQQHQQQYLLENNDDIINDNYINILLQLFINKIMEELSSSSSSSTVQMINDNGKVTLHDIIQLCQLLSSYLQNRKKSNLMHAMKETIYNFVRSIRKYIDTNTLTKKTDGIIDSNNYVLLHTSLYQIQNHADSVNLKNNYNDKMTSTSTIALNLFKSIHTRNIKSLSSSSLLQIVSF